MYLREGVSPAARQGFAVLYVDELGNVKVKLSNGTERTLMVSEMPGTPGRRQQPFVQVFAPVVIVISVTVPLFRTKTDGQKLGLLQASRLLSRSRRNGSRYPRRKTVQAFRGTRRTHHRVDRGAPVPGAIRWEKGDPIYIRAA